MGKPNYYTRKKTIDGVEYTAQFNGLSAALDAVDQSYLEGTGNMGMKKLAGYILQNVVVSPAGLSVDDFEDLDTLNAVVKFGREVMQGRFRNPGEQEGKKEKG